jgi:hypothetical protein
MPIPSPNRFKDKDSFMERCMEIEIGSGKPANQALAICSVTWDNRNMKKTTQQIVNQKLSDINKKEELISPNPCEEGYIAIGLKPKGGRMVPNCVPQE